MNHWMYYFGAAKHTLLLPGAVLGLTTLGFILYLGRKRLAFAFLPHPDPVVVMIARARSDQ